MANYGIKVEGLDKVQKMLHQADANAALIVGIEFGIKELQQKVSAYPPTSEANYPQTTVTDGKISSIRWYERGYGTKYIRSDGSEGGKRTSAPLKDKWQTKLFKGTNPKGEIWNNADYGIWVHGHNRDYPGQARIHGERGWKSLPVEGKKMAPEITKKIIEAFKARMNK